MDAWLHTKVVTKAPWRQWAAATTPTGTSRTRSPPTTNKSSAIRRCITALKASAVSTSFGTVATYSNNHTSNCMQLTIRIRPKVVFRDYRWTRVQTRWQYFVPFFILNATSSLPTRMSFYILFQTCICPKNIKKQIHQWGTWAAPTQDGP